MEVFGALPAVLAQDEVVHHARLQRAGTVERHQGDDVLEAVALQPPLQILGGARFRLEHGGGVAGGEQGVGAGVVERQVFEPEVVQLGIQLTHEFHRLVEDGQRAQAEEVELHQADLLDVVLVELADHRLGAGGDIERAEIGEPAGRDQHAAGMHADVAGEALELFGQRPQLGQLLFALQALLDLRLFLPRLGKADADFVGDQLGKLVDEVERQVEHPADVADHRLGRQGAEGRDLRHAGGAVALLDVVDDTVAAVLAEVDVEVGHRHPLRIEEALEQQVVAQRVEVGDAQRIGHQRAGARAAPWPDRHAVPLGPVDEVGDDQEVAGKAHLPDGADLEGEALLVLRALGRTRGGVGEELGKARLQPCRGLLRHELVQGQPLGRRELGQLVLAQFDRQRAAARDFHRIGECLGEVGEQFGHLGLGLEVLLVGEVLGPARVAEDVALGDAHPRFVGLEVIAVEELHRMGRHHRQPEFGGEPDAAADEGFLLGAAARLDALQFDVVAVREPGRPLPRQLLRQGVVAGEQRLADVATLGAGQRDQVRVVARRELRAGDFGAATTAVAEVGVGEQCAQPQVAGAVLRQQQGAGAVAAAAVARLRHPDVAADDRLDALGARRGVELDHAEQIGEVGQRQRRHAVGGGALDGGVEAHQPVGDGVLGVQAQVYEGGSGHGARFYPPPPCGTSAGNASTGAGRVAAPRRPAADKALRRAKFVQPDVRNFTTGRSFAASRP